MSLEQEVWHKMALTPAETSYNAGILAASLTRWNKLTGPGIFVPDLVRETDQPEIKGHPYATETSRKKVEDRVEGSWELRADVQHLPFWIGALCSGVTTVGAADPWTHTAKWPGIATAAPISTSIIQGIDRALTASQWHFDGIVPQTVEIAIEGPGFITSTVSIVGSGKYTQVTGETPPAIDTAVGGDRLCFDQITTLALGTAGTESIKNIVRSMSIVLNANLVAEVVVGSGRQVNLWQYTNDGIVLEVTITVKGTKGDTLWNFWQADTKLKLDLLIEETATTRSIRLQGNAVYLGKPTEGFDELGATLELPLMFQFVVGDASPFIWTFKNDVPVYH